MLRRNVLIFHSGALGDFVLTWPLALAVGRIFAQSRIIYVAASQKGKLAEEVLRVESVDSEGGWYGLFADSAPTLPEPAAKLLSGAAFVFSFVSDGNDAWARNLRALAPYAQLVTLAPRPVEPYAGGHVTDFHLEQLRDHVAVEAAVRQILRSVAERGVGRARTPEKDRVLLHPGSGSPKKNWPLGRFVELAKRLRDEGRTVRALLGEVEAEEWAAGDVAKLGAVAEIHRPATYVELYRELASAGTLVTNDTGPGHLAGIIGVPTVALFGPTEPAVWKPLGPRVAAVRGAALADISVEDVIARLRAIQP